MTTTLIRGFWAFERIAPRLRSLVWRTFYDAVAVAFPHPDVRFMNWGYVPLAEEEVVPLSWADEPYRTVIQLYAHTIDAVDLAGRDVVEVGSGRGGGSAWVARNRSPRSVTGYDISPRVVALARRLHSDIPTLRFERADALALPLGDSSVDAILNVESCHHYGSMQRFLGEVVRVLRPGGYLLLSDYREAGEMVALESDLATADLVCLNHRDITANVLAALDRDHLAKEAMLRERVPRPLRTIMRTFMGNRGTDVYEGFRTRRWLYGSWVMRKPGGGGR